MTQTLHRCMGRYGVKKDTSKSVEDIERREALLRIYDTGDFWNKFVVQEKDSRMIKDEKIKKWKRLTGQ